MSLDFSLKKMKMVYVLDKNATHNLVPMWKKAGCYDALYMSEGKPAQDILDELVNGYITMKLFKDEFEKINPENGWGTYEGALEFLKIIINGCLDYPNAIININK